MLHRMHARYPCAVRSVLTILGKVYIKLSLTRRQPSANVLLREKGDKLSVQEFVMRKALVCGAGGFIGSHLVKRLKKEGFWVRGIDLVRPHFSATAADDFIVGDLRDAAVVNAALDVPFDEIYQLAADMGGAGYIFTGEHDADVMHNSATINLNVLDTCRRTKFTGRIFYSSSACIYPLHNQLDPDNPKCSEESAYPAAPDSEYGWEKLFSERMYAAYARNYGITCRVARYHNIFGPEGSWNNGKERHPLPSAARSQKPMTAARSRSGVTACRRDPSCISTNAWTAR